MIKRGDIYYADLHGTCGSEQGGFRPVVVIQNDKGNRYSNTLIIAPISTRMTKPPLPTHVILSTDFLSKTSMVLLEQIRTIDKKRLGQWVCTLDNTLLSEIDQALKVSLGL